MAAVVAAGAVALAGPAVEGRAADSPVCRVRTTPPAARALAGSRSVPDPVGHPRLERWSLRSPAMSGAEVVVNVLVPAGYSGGRNGPRYPVLYLFHGHGGGADDWRKEALANGTSLEAIVGSLPLVVVMPDGGYDGWYSDWYGVDVDGHNGADPERAPAWETFHLGELVPFVQAQYRTSDRRLIAGLSMGGFGALSYAGRHPDLFAAAGSFSGAVDMRNADPVQPLLLSEAMNFPDRRPADRCIWGDAVTQHDRWAAHNPADLLPALRAMPLFVSSGDGRPGPGESSPSTPGAAGLEFGVRHQNDAFHSRDASLCAGTACAPRRYELYSPGTHSWPYWLAELSHFLAWVHGDLRLV